MAFLDFYLTQFVFVIVDIANRSSITKGPDMGVYKRESTQYYHNVVSSLFRTPLYS